MSDISKIDKNFEITTEIEREGLVFHSITEPPFSVHGLIREWDAFVRMPCAVAEKVSVGVFDLARHTAGGRVRFITDSPYVVIKAETPGAYMMPHMPETGLGGFDLYTDEGEGEKYFKSFIPSVPPKPEYDSVADFPTEKERLLTVNFPLYCRVKNLYIGLKEGCVLKKAPDYSISAPFVYYGSSITQGGCASRPGNSYQAMICRRFNADYINLGFSGNAKGEDAMIEYLAGLDMSLFVLDYDHNAPSNEHLLATHEKLFMRMRETHPDIPIIIMSRPKPYSYLNAMERGRADIIKATYENAKARGDENVYYIPGWELCEICGGEGTVDGTHPTDLGFYSMYVRLADEIKSIIDSGKLKV